MVMTDPIADFLTRIRNANTAMKATVEIPASKMKKALAEILKQEGFIKNWEYVEDSLQGVIRVYLKYGDNKEHVISGLKRISKPGLRVHVGKDDVPQVLNGLGIAILTTSHGIMTDKQAKAAGVGGEIICYVW